jgi:hypothetical protein
VITSKNMVALALAGAVAGCGLAWLLLRSHKRLPGVFSARRPRGAAAAESVACCRCAAGRVPWGPNTWPFMEK